MTTELFLFLCKQSKLQIADLEYMTIGFCLDYIDEYIEQTNPKKKKKIKTASQSDFDNF